MDIAFDIFFVADSIDRVVCPPDQVFRNEKFEFLLSYGGHLVEDAQQYSKLMAFWEEIGENGFSLRENFGATTPSNNRKEPLSAYFSTRSTLGEFNHQLILLCQVKKKA